MADYKYRGNQPYIPDADKAPAVPKPPKPPKPRVPPKKAKCGTRAAHSRHKRNGEPVDDPCRLAHNADVRRRRAEKNGAKP